MDLGGFRLRNPKYLASAQILGEDVVRGCVTVKIAQSYFPNKMIKKLFQFEIPLVWSRFDLDTDKNVS